MGSTKIDVDYFLQFDQPQTGNFYFRGFSGLTSISYSSGGQFSAGWIIKSYRIAGIDSVLGYFNDTMSSFPIGLQNWNLRTNCDILQKEFFVEKLRLSEVLFCKIVPERIFWFEN